MYTASSVSTFDLVFWSHHKYNINNDLQPSNDADWSSHDHVTGCGVDPRGRSPFARNVIILNVCDWAVSNTTGFQRNPSLILPVFPVLDVPLPPISELATVAERSVAIKDSRVSAFHPRAGATGRGHQSVTLALTSTLVLYRC
jgi:hypothetical protein